MRQANLASSSFLTIVISSVVWPVDAQSVDLSGMTYQNIQVNQSPDTNGHAEDGPLSLINRAPYDASVYDNLEAFYQRQGDTAAVDRIFGEQMKRQRDILWMNQEWLAWALSTGRSIDNYGRDPELLVVYILIFIFIGGLIFFREGNMKESVKATTTPKHYNALLYSLGLFVPGLQLKITSDWKPKDDASIWRSIVRGYRYVHIFIGGLFVPIVLVAFTGFIK
jgi:hypothetical protein